MSYLTPPDVPAPELIRKLASRLAYPDEGTFVSSSVSLLEEIRHVCLKHSISEQDYIIETETLRILDKMIKLVRVNRDFECRIAEMDYSIGLLVRNSLLTRSLEALKEMKNAVSQSRKGRRKNQLSGSLHLRKWINFDIGKFSSYHCPRIKCYSHLFYALQTQPRYLSRLLFAVPTFQVSSFFKNCIHSLFFHEPWEREIYLLCRLLKQSLKEEVTHKITKVSYIIDGDPIIITIALDCHRAHRQALFDLLQPVILDIVALKEPILCLDPIALYKDHYNLSEPTDSTDDKTQADLSIEQALNDNQVRAQLAYNIPQIVRACGRLIDTIVSPEFIDLIPFGLKYICKSLDAFLGEKLGSNDGEAGDGSESYGEEERIRVICNIIFTRWIRPCILFPEAYLTHMRDNEKRTSLVSRRNLNGVYKILQAAVTGKRMFTFSPMLPQTEIILEETQQLDHFLGSTWFQLKHLVDSICLVDEISDIFFFTEFSDEASEKPPTVSLTFQEIMDSHSILHSYQNDIAPDPNDPLDAEFHILMEDCGPPHPDIQDLLGCDPEYVASVGADTLMNFEVHLPLRVRAFADLEEISSATIKVKQALIELIRQRPDCKDLNQVLFRKVEPEENSDYLNYKRTLNWCLPLHAKRHSVLHTLTGRSLPTLLEFTIQNMRHTEARSFDEILAMITNDIINKLQYRNHRYAKMLHLEEVFKSLLEKRTHLAETKQTYTKYLAKCKSSYQFSTAIEKLFSKSLTDNESRPCLVYTASKLKEMGILVSLKEVKQGNLKKIKIEMAASPDDTLKVSFRFFKPNGVDLFKMQLCFTHLLKLQYDGHKMVSLQGTAFMNVDYLIYLFNSKFYLRTS